MSVQIRSDHFLHFEFYQSLLPFISDENFHKIKNFLKYSEICLLLLNFIFIYIIQKLNPNFLTSQISMIAANSTTVFCGKGNQ